MIFEKITLENFATYKGQNTIDLMPSIGKPIILIGGENGCGKTTLLDAFQLVLFGAAGRFSNRGKLSYETFLERCINRECRPEDGARIKLSFEFYYDGQKKDYSIERAWFKKGKKIQEQLYVYQMVEGQLKYQRTLSENWADYVEGFFPSQIAPFFFFDGEQIEKLADFEKSRDLIESAINSLLGLNLVNQLQNDLISLERRKVKELAGKEADSSLNSIELEIQYLKEKIDSYITLEGQLNNQADFIITQLQDVDILFRRHGGDLYEKRSEIQANLSAAQKGLAAHEERAREIASGAAPLLLVQNLLVLIRKQAEEEDKAIREELLYETLQQRDEEILTQLTNLVAAPEARSRMADYLKRDRDSRLASTKIEKFLGLGVDGTRLLGQLENELPTLGRALPEQAELLQKERNEIEMLERTLSGVPEESKIAAIIDKQEDFREKLRDVKLKLAINGEELERARRQVEQKKSELRRELTRIAESRFEGKDTRRMTQYSAKVRATLQAFRAKMFEKHIDQIEDLVYSSFKNLLRKESLVGSLRIDRLSCQISLFNLQGEEILPERLSAGERQLLATALLWGICQAAGKPLPTIIDTPLGRLDTSHRTNLIENYFPHASEQVLLLSTNEEIVGKYYEQLKPYISQTYLLKYDEQTRGTKVLNGYFSKG